MRAWVAVGVMLVAGVASAAPSKKIREIAAGDMLRDPVEAAREACVFSAGAWSCDPDALAKLRQVAQYDRVDADGVSVTVRPVAAGNCVTHVDAAVAAADRDVAVDWTRVVFLRDGQAVAALPGFTRGITDNLAQRQSFVPAGAVLRENVVPQGQDVCLFDLRTTQSLELVLPVGRDGSSVRWAMTRAIAPETEANALRMLTGRKTTAEPEWRSRLTTFAIVFMFPTLLAPYFLPLWSACCLVPAVTHDVWQWRKAVAAVRESNADIEAQNAAAEKRFKEMEQQ